MEFVVGTISLSCELYSLSWSCFGSCEVGTIVYGNGVLFYMCSAVEVACTVVPWKMHVEVVSIQWRLGVL